MRIRRSKKKENEKTKQFNLFKSLSLGPAVHAGRIIGIRKKEREKNKQHKENKQTREQKDEK